MPLPTPRLLALLLALAAAGCGEDTTTVGGQCRLVMDAYCSRIAYSCDGMLSTREVADCVEAGEEACCAGRCAKPALSTLKRIDSCRSALRSTKCNGLDLTKGAEGALPKACVGVVYWGADPDPTPDPEEKPAAGSELWRYVGLLISK